MKKILIAAAMASFGSGAMAADLPSKKTAPAPAPVVYVPPAFTWTGFYVGANLGVNYTNFGPNFGSATAAALGGTAGFNYQVGQWVVGLEGDYDVMHGGTRSASALGSTKARATSLATFRARAGYAVDRTMFFITGGYAGLQVAETANSIPAVDKHWQNGIALGAGVEYAVTNNVTVKLEDIYSTYAGKTFFAGTPEQNKNRQHDNILRMGVNYKF